MAASDHAKPISLRDDALAIVHRLVHAGHIAYFAGGCVRDMLLGLEPKDFDVATSATPDQARRVFPRAQGVGQAFGVLLIREGRSIIELATFRSDGDYTDGRRPDKVHFATPEADARRRDFTINGLFFDPVQNKLIDFVGGEADLKSNTLRAIGDPAQRFAEDYLRLLRAVRFAARFDLNIDPATADAIRANAHKLPRIAPERICDELRAMLAPATRPVAVRHLETLGLMPVLFRNLADTPLESVAKERTFTILAAEPTLSFALALVSLSIDLLRAIRPLDVLLTPTSTKQIAHALRSTFRLSNDESAALDGIFGAHRLLETDEPTVATMKRFLAEPTSSDARRFLQALASVGHRADRIAWLERTFASFAPETIAPTPLLNGNDLQLAGFSPGPRFKIALDAAYDAQLEGRATTRETALALAVSIVRSS